MGANCPRCGALGVRSGNIYQCAKCDTGETWNADSIVLGRDAPGGCGVFNTAELEHIGLCCSKDPDHGIRHTIKCMACNHQFEIPVGIMGNGPYEALSYWTFSKDTIKGPKGVIVPEWYRYNITGTGKFGPGRLVRWAAIKEFNGGDRLTWDVPSHDVVVVFLMWDCPFIFVADKTVFMVIYRDGPPTRRESKRILQGFTEGKTDTATADWILADLLGVKVKDLVV